MKTIGVIGLGEHEIKIIQRLILNGFHVVAADLSNANIEKSISMYVKCINKCLKAGLISQAEKVRMIEKITIMENVSDVESCDFVIRL